MGVEGSASPLAPLSCHASYVPYDTKTLAYVKADWCHLQGVKRVVANKTTQQAPHFDWLEGGVTFKVSQGPGHLTRGLSIGLDCTIPYLLRLRMPQDSHCIKLTWLVWTVGWVVGNKTTWTFCRLLLLSTCSSSPFMLHAIALNLTYPLPLYTLVQLWRSCEAAHFRPCLHIAFPPPSNPTSCLVVYLCICVFVFVYLYLAQLWSAF